MSENQAEQSLMHMLQAFLVETIRQVHAALPADITVTTAGRTIVRGTRGGREFGVRVRLGHTEDDMWPHVEAVLELDGTERTFEVHPDTTASGHADVIVERLVAALSGDAAGSAP